MTFQCDPGDFDPPPCHCESAVEHLFKAIAEDPTGEPSAIWRPHENEFIRDHVEDVSRRLIGALDRIADALAGLLRGEMLGTLAKAMAPWLRWDPQRFEQTREYLESKPPELFTLDDWMLVVDYLIQRYLPDSVIQDEAEYLTVRASILGKIQATYGSPLPPPPDIMQAWATLTPTYFAEVAPRALSDFELQIMQVAKAHAANSIQHVADAVRSRMNGVIIQHVQAQVLGQKEGTNQILATRLFDEFGELNRNMRRIAVTEAGECCLQGFIAATPVGAKVQRREAYRNACKFCRSIDGMEFTVVAPNDPNRDGWLHVWPGKSNIGRSASPNRREGGLLVERAPHERWWPAAGVMHPFCRGVWLAIARAVAGASPEFLKLMESMVQVHRSKSLTTAI